MTLTYGLMGTLLLGLAWVTAALVTLDALIDARRVRALQRAWAGRVVEAAVGDQPLGWHELEQRVRMLEVPAPALGFWDRAHRWGLVGGRATLADGAAVQVVPQAGAEVWPDHFEQRAQSADAALWVTAATTQGALRVVRTELKPGQRVWLVGAGDDEVFRAELASAIDPRAWARGRQWRIAALIALNLAWVAAGTALALWPPAFGLVSKLGAAALLGHFLGITPLAILVRDCARAPSLAFLRGEQRREAGPADRAAPSGA
jgi:hypothetical protein